MNAPVAAPDRQFSHELCRSVIGVALRAKGQHDVRHARSTCRVMMQTVVYLS